MMGRESVHLVPNKAQIGKRGGLRERFRFSDQRAMYTEIPGIAGSFGGF